MAQLLASVPTIIVRRTTQKQMYMNIIKQTNLRCALHSATTSPALHSQPVVTCNHDFSWGNKSTTCGKCNILGPTLQRQLFTSAIPMYLQYNSAGYSQIDTNWIILRSLHTTATRWKDGSIAEKSVQAIKDKAKQSEKSTEEAAASTAASEEVTTSTETLNELKAKETVILQKTVDSVEESTTKPTEPVPEKSETKVTVAEVKKSIPQRILAELKHYYHGFRLLFMDVRVCMRYVRYVLNGRSLTRRERRQFVRTAADLFRLVPFSVFIIVPFMEFLLPVALKLFPNMLPSTFAEAGKEQEKLRSRLKVKLEMAKFLQDTIEETALQKKGKKNEAAAKFAAFLEQIRTSGTETNVEEIKQYSKLFEDEITLDTLSHQQLMALCRLLEIPMPHLGTSNFLRFQLRQTLRQLKNDDKMIKKEGIDSLALWELQEACRARGMRSLGVPLERLKSQLDQWLRLHLEENIPTSLLLLSRALYLSETLSTEEQLKKIIVELPSTAAEEAKVKISEVSGERVDNKTKLDVIKQEEVAIRAERKAEAQAKKAAEDKKEAKAKDADMDTIIQNASSPTEPSIVDSAPELKPDAKEVLVDKATELKDHKEEPAEAKKKEEEEEETEISAEELEQVEDIIEQVAEEKKIALEKNSLKALKEDVEEYKEAVSELKTVVLATGEEDIQESKAAQRLSQQVDKMMNEMEKAMDKLFEDKKQLIEDIEVKEVRVKRSLQEDSEARDKVLDEISETKAELISINDVLLSMRKIQKAPDDTKLQRILQVLDEDQDGQIDVTDALKVIELLGKDNMKLSSKQVSAIMNAIKHEDLIAREEKERKRLEKLEEAEKANSEEMKTDANEELKDTAKDLNKSDKRTDSIKNEASQKQ